MIKTYVYLFECDGEYKIGRSTKPKSRITAVRPGKKPNFVVACAYAGAFQLEKELHKRFSSVALGHEWFALTPEDVAGITEQFVLDGGSTNIDDLPFCDPADDFLSDYIKFDILIPPIMEAEFRQTIYEFFGSSRPQDLGQAIFSHFKNHGRS